MSSFTEHLRERGKKEKNERRDAGFKILDKILDNGKKLTGKGAYYVVEDIVEYLKKKNPWFTPDNLWDMTETIDKSRRFVEHLINKDMSFSKKTRNEKVKKLHELIDEYVLYYLSMYYLPDYILDRTSSYLRDIESLTKRTSTTQNLLSTTIKNINKYGALTKKANPPELFEEFIKEDTKSITEAINDCRERRADLRRETRALDVRLRLATDYRLYFEDPVVFMERRERRELSEKFRRKRKKITKTFINF